MKYVWEDPLWPNFDFDQNALVEGSAKYERNDAMLVGVASALSSQDVTREAQESVVDEAIATSLIESEHLHREDVRSSLRKHLGLPGPASKNEKADGIVALLMDVRNNHTPPLSHERLHAWHRYVLHGPAPLFGRPLTIGSYRHSEEPMRIVSGDVVNPTVHYVAPPAQDIHQHMDRFFTWFNADESKNLPAPVKAGIAHLWFEQIHPYEDGNGRIGRAIAEYSLAQHSPAGVPPFSLSDAINRERKSYNKALNDCNTSLSITPYLQWFIDTCLKAQEKALSRFRITAAKAVYWREFTDSVSDPAQQRAINKIFDAGADGFTEGLSPGKYASLAKVSRQTATRHLTSLLNSGALVKLAGGGRSTRYAPASQTLIRELQLDVNPLHALRLAVRNEQPGPTSQELISAIANLGNALDNGMPLSQSDSTAAVDLLSRLNKLPGKLFRGAMVCDAEPILTLQEKTISYEPDPYSPAP